MKGDKGVAGWGVSSVFPNVKVGFSWPKPDPGEPNVNPVGGLGFSSNLPPKGFGSPDVVPKLNGELVFPVPWPKLSTRPAKNESSFGREVVTSTTLVGLSSILTSSSSLGGVTGRGKLPNGCFCVPFVSELAPNVKTSELGVLCEGPPNCGATGFSGELEGAPNLKANENAGFASFGISLSTVGVLTDSPGDGVGIGSSRVNGFGASIELVAPNPTNDVPDELPNENIDVVGTFCSELVAAGVGPIVEDVGATPMVEAFVDSTAGLSDDNPPNKPGSGWALGGGPGETLGGFPLKGVGGASGVVSTFAEGVGKFCVAWEEITGVETTGGVGRGKLD